MSGIRTVLRLAVVTACVVATAAVSVGGSAAATSRHEPTAHRYAGTPTVGALFRPGAFPLHTCTASVVRTRARDVIVTAAHCIDGTGAGFVFAPGYDEGRTPYGLWRVTRAYAAPGWLKDQDPQRDFAFLVVAGHARGTSTVQVQTRAGGNRFSAAPRHHVSVVVPAYPMGTVNRPITCRNKVTRSGRYPEFDCGGYVDGTSGSPWLAGRQGHRRVVGLVGGLHQGGCLPSVSYSSSLGRVAAATLRRAARHATPDVFPVAHGDGC